jgi:homoserine O-acetyltransferase
LEKAFEKSESEFLLVALSSDWLFPPEQSRELGEVLLRLKNVVSVVELDSPYGHDAFLLEVENLSQVIQGFLEKPAYAEPHLPVAPPRRRSRPRGGLGRPKPDWDLIADLVEPGSHILDIGCGDGGLIDALFRSQGVTGIGIEVSLEHAVSCLRRNVPVIQANVDRGLPFLDDDSFDYAVLNRTLPEVRRPRELLQSLLRVAKKAIVAFPNFGHVGNRASLLLRGGMPVTRSLPMAWYETPNIHLFSLKDFESLCQSEGFQIEALRTQSGSPWSQALLALGLKNFGAETVVAQIGRKKV